MKIILLSLVLCITSLLFGSPPGEAKSPLTYSLPVLATSSSPIATWQPAPPQPIEIRWEYAIAFDDEQYALVQASVLRSNISSHGKLSWDLGAGPAIGTKFPNNLPVYGVFGSATANYATGGFKAYAGLAGYGFVEQAGPKVGRAAFVIGAVFTFN